MRFQFMLLVTVTGWYRTKCPMHCGLFLMYYASSSEFYLFVIHPPELSGKYQQRYLIAKQERLSEECPLILPQKYLCHTPEGSVTCSTTWDQRLLFPSKGSRATNFIALRNPSSSAGFEPANFRYSGKHDNH
jgi:hypothetical protein